jgi:hypothetical protein
MKGPGRKRPHGQMRQSQVVTTFGPGAMIDLPNNAVMLSGLEHWRGVDRQIFEERLAAKVQQLLAVPSIKLFAPPPESDDPTAAPTGIAVWLFPLWFVAQYEEKRERNIRSRPLVHYQALIKDRYTGADRKSYPVVPIRFVQACTRGHISDVDWHLYVHDHGDPCRRPLWLDERGTSGDLADVTVRCECGRTKTMAAAAKFQDRPFGYCAGRLPWLGPAAHEHCGGDDAKSEPSRLLVRSASNAYFAQKLSAISIPDASAAIRAAVDNVFEDFLQYVESAAEIARERRKARVHAALEGLTDEEVWREIQRRKGGHVPQVKGIKQAEIETLLSSMVGTTEDVPDGDYFARALPGLPRSPLLASIDRVVLVHRLREVIAQVGFTRFESAVPDVDGELSLDVKRADLALETSWVPAVENRGEGFFIALKTEAIEAWRERPAVQARGKALLAGFDAWKADHPGTKTEFPGLAYVMLHTLSHLLITAVSLECGYASTSIRERVYATRSGYGILLYTGTSDAEGTLGGLVQVARRIEQHLRMSLDLGGLCANDPVCAQHRPDAAQEQRYLSGAACHGCLYIGETSCERMNDFLDRSLVVPTVEGLSAEFFGEDLL